MEATVASCAAVRSVAGISYESSCCRRMFLSPCGCAVFTLCGPHIRREVDSQPDVRPMPHTHRKNKLSGMGLETCLPRWHIRKNGRNRIRAAVHAIATDTRRTFVAGKIIGSRRPIRSPMFMQTMCSATITPSFWRHALLEMVSSRYLVHGYPHSVTANKTKMLALHGTKLACTRLILVHDMSGPCLSCSTCVHPSMRCLIKGARSMRRNARQVTNSKRAYDTSTLRADLLF